MVKGNMRDQQLHSDCIFTHLKNVLASEINTGVLKYTSRFITTLLLLGNPHVYDNFAKYLLPVFKDKIKEDYRNGMKPIWPIQQFCKEILHLLADWIPHDYYDEDRPSLFAKAAKELQCKTHTFINIDKLIISYRILKSIKLDGDEGMCKCQQC
jgi:hypothetical protein